MYTGYSFELFPEDTEFERIKMDGGKVDFLVTSCALHRIKKTNPIEASKLGGRVSDRKLVSMITTEDVIHAAKIREFYSKKIMMWKLLDKNLSQFRVKLASFLADSTGIGTTQVDLNEHEKLMGIAYRLPEFYAYDMELDSLKSDSLCDLTDNDKVVITDPVTLVPVANLQRSTRQNKVSVYIFTINGTKKPVMAEFMRDNPLLPIWDEVFAAKLPIVFSGNLVKKTINDFCCYELKKIKNVRNISVTPIGSNI